MPTLTATGAEVTLIGHGSLIAVGSDLYLARDCGAGEQWRVTKLDETHAEYLVRVYGNDTCACDCKDATYRHRRCKHQFAVLEAMKEW